MNDKTGSYRTPTTGPEELRKQLDDAACKIDKSLPTGHEVLDLILGDLVESLRELGAWQPQGPVAERARCQIMRSLVKTEDFVLRFRDWAIVEGRREGEGQPEGASD